ncbi:uncharacterized protein LOC142784523 [Rhipicephalus microplus]|uniref:uncharacterized protein LOC142784523 n=1 Tax=Rhipicephalus microplus TaxID=6941 RepID=UPI003F6AE4BC
MQVLVLLDETEFSSLAGAQKASFVCRLCEALKAAVQRIEPSIEGLQGELRAEREQTNMARVRDGIFKTVKEDGRVIVEAQSRKGMVDALAKAQEVVEDSIKGENLVFIHAGLNDVLKGKDQNLQRQLKDGMRKLRQASGSVHVTICTVPEVWGKSRGT